MDSIFDILGPSEAQAFPIGKVFKVGQKALGSLSSASKRLVGKSVQGKIVKEVRRGRGNWRQIVFDDGTVLPITKDYVHSLARAKGTEQYVNAFVEKSREGQLQQALKSMSIHESMVYPPETTKVGRAITENQHEIYKKMAQTLQSMPPDSVMVRRGKKSYMLPQVYAEILQRHGILTIIKKKVTPRMAASRDRALDRLFKDWNK